MSLLAIIITLVAAGISFLTGWIVRGIFGKDKISRAESYSQQLIDEAREEAESIKREKILEAEEQIFKQRRQSEEEEKEKQAQYRKIERQLVSRETSLDRKVDILNQKEKHLFKLESSLRHKEKQIATRENELNQLLDEQNRRLEQISGMSSDEARRVQLENILDSAREEAANSIKEIKDKAKLTAQKQAREIIIQAIQRAAIDHVVESTVSIVQLPTDDMKGRIIGREGRNIRAFEAATGIEVLIDDTPGQVMLSGFDPIRREIAKLALEKLIYDGRIHPGRIEEVIEKTRLEIEERIFEYGEQALVDVGLHNMHHELIKMIGQLKFQASQGQNVLQHSIEVALVAGLMATELELDPMSCRRAGLLHEIGYAVDNYSGGTAAELAADIAKKYGESEHVQNAILYANAYEIGNNALSPTAVLVSAANEISRARPGAQKEVLQNYIKRLKSLEEIANSFMGVTKSYAIQAGRELRVIVGNVEVDDVRTDQLAAAIAKKIRDNLSYPGQIKINVIREYRSVSYAK